MEKEIQIPNGFEAKIEGNMVVFVPKESEDERIRNCIVELLRKAPQSYFVDMGTTFVECFAYLEKQKEQPVLPGIEEPGIPGKDYIPVEWVDVCERYGKWKIVKQEQPDVSAKHGWVARDMNNDLHYFSVKPVRSGAKWWDRDYLSMEIDGSLFGELTWEDEPIEVELFIRELGLNARKEE